MARNTNIEEITFPVELRPVFVEGNNQPIKGYKAVVGTFNIPGNLFGEEHTLSIVTNNYMLISNKDALQMAKDIHHQLFSEGSSDSFEIFNIKAPKTLGSCHIDIIDKNYKLNILKEEVYVPFVRIQNSYNKTMPLRFQVGFCRKLCDNGVIFEENSISINLHHTKSHFHSFNFKKIDVSMLKKFEADFISKTTKADKIAIPKDLFIPLAAKALNMKFNIDKNNNERYESEHDRLVKFTIKMQEFTDRYVRDEKLGETAYAFFNVITDYASNNEHLQARSTHTMQCRCGNWLTEFCQRNYNNEVDWNKELIGYEQLVN